MSQALLLAAAVVFLVGTVGALARGRTARAAGWPLLILAYGIPALFFLFALHRAPEDAHRFRLALLGFGLRAEENRSFTGTIGGDPEKDDIWVGRMGEEAKLGRLDFTPPAAEGQKGTVTVDVAGASGGLIRVGSDNLIRKIQLQDGDVLTIGDVRWTLERLKKRLDADLDRWVPLAGGEAIELPQRNDRLGLTIWRPLSVGRATFPLRGLLGLNAPLKSFFYYDPTWLSGDLYLVALEPEVGIERAGARLNIDTSHLATGRTTSLHMMRLYRTTGDPAQAGGIVDLRSFDVVPGRQSLSVALHTPEVYTLRWDQLAELETKPPDGEEPEEAERMRLGLAMGDWPVGDKHLHLKYASQAVAGEAIASLNLPRQRPTAWTEPFQITAPGGRREAEPGQPFWLGRDHAAALQVDLLSPPLRLAYLTLLLALFKIVAAQASRVSRAAVGFFAAVEMLVLIRLLLAYRVWAMPPFHQEAIDLALIAWALLPWTLLGASMPPFSEDRTLLGNLGVWLPTLGGLFFSLAWCLALSDGKRQLVWIAVHGAVILLPCLRDVRLRERAARVRRRTAELAARGAARCGALVRTRTPLPRVGDAVQRNRFGGWILRHWPERDIWLWCLAAGLVFVLRIGLLFLGARESLYIGVRISLSLVHLPLALLIQGGYLIWLWRRFLKTDRLPLADLLPAGAMVAFLWVGPAGVVSDFGLMLLNIPVLFLAMASLSAFIWSHLAAGFSRPSWVVALPVLAIVGYVLVVATPPGTQGLINLYKFADRVLTGSEDENEIDRNLLRALQFAKPEAIKQAGLKASEELAIMATVMSKYTVGPLAGRGYFKSEISPHLRATALREHVPAIFVAGEWGLWGSLALVLLFAAIFFSGRALLPWLNAVLRDHSAPVFTEVASIVAALAAWTFALSSLYMILANYDLVLFTGRNTYLLGLDSTADVLEALTFCVLFAWGAAVVNEEERYS